MPRPVRRKRREGKRWRDKAGRQEEKLHGVQGHRFSGFSGFSGRADVIPPGLDFFFKATRFQEMRKREEKRAEEKSTDKNER